MAAGRDRDLCCNDTEDVGFVRALVEDARRRWGADPDRVYATGASNGAASLVAFHGRQDGVFSSMEEGVAAWRRRLGAGRRGSSRTAAAGG